MSTSSAKYSHQQVINTQSWESSSNFELGPNTTFTYYSDPRRVCFMLSRYKFCSKMLFGRDKVLEVGCGDAFGTPLVAQDVGQVMGVDWDPTLINSNIQRLTQFKNCSFKQHDIVSAVTGWQYDGAYSLDVIEHVDNKSEDDFIKNITSGLSDDGILIIGTPNVAAEAYASESSKVGHINLKDSADLKRLVSKYMKTVLMFSMNDDVVHTGFFPMAHYLFAVGIGVKR